MFDIDNFIEACESMCIYDTYVDIPVEIIDFAMEARGLVAMKYNFIAIRENLKRIVRELIRKITRFIKSFSIRRHKKIAEKNFTREFSEFNECNRDLSRYIANIESYMNRMYANGEEVVVKLHRQISKADVTHNPELYNESFRAFISSRIGDVTDLKNACNSEREALDRAISEELAIAKDPSTLMIRIKELLQWTLAPIQNNMIDTLEFRIVKMLNYMEGCLGAMDIAAINNPEVTDKLSNEIGMCNFVITQLNTLQAAYVWAIDLK